MHRERCHAGLVQWHVHQAETILYITSTISNTTITTMAILMYSWILV